jgi:hypothetical protein
MHCLSQTRESDYKFIIGNFGDSSQNYRVTELGKWALDEPGSSTRRTVQFKRIKSLNDNKNRGIAIIYWEVIDGEARNQRIFCAPEKNTESAITIRSLQAIQNVSDDRIRFSVLWGLMRLSVERN